MKKINGIAVDQGADSDVNFGYACFQFALLNAACDEFFRRRGLHSKYNGRPVAKAAGKLLSQKNPGTDE